MRRIAEGVWQVPGVAEPLSADSFIIEGAARYYVYDVGASDAAYDAIAALDKPVTVILSHFHRDHTANLSRLSPETVLVGARTRRQLGTGTLVDAPLVIRDGVTIEVQPCVSPHAPGCLIATVNGRLTFIGDLAYGHPDAGQGEARGMLRALKGVRTQAFVVSHAQEETLISRDVFLAQTAEHFGVRP